MTTRTITLSSRPPGPPRDPQTSKTVYLKLSNTDPKCRVRPEPDNPAGTGTGTGTPVRLNRNRIAILKIRFRLTGPDFLNINPVPNRNYNRSSFNMINGQITTILKSEKEIQLNSGSSYTWTNNILLCEHWIWWQLDYLFHFWTRS